jgi:fucose 4-O-acetylase-like acetyltransferase
MNWVSLFDKGLFYAVPVFTFLAGVLSWGAPWKGGPGAYAGFVRRRMLAVGVPYLAWCVLFYVLRPAGGQGMIPGSPLGIVRDFVELVISGRMWFHLYFVPMLIVLFAHAAAARAVRRHPGWRSRGCGNHLRWV